MMWETFAQLWESISCLLTFPVSVGTINYKLRIPSNTTQTRPTSINRSYLLYPITGIKPAHLNSQGIPLLRRAK